jgi:hypothetical protein
VLDQVEVLEAAGANLRQVVIGHLNEIEKEPSGPRNRWCRCLSTSSVLLGLM